MRVVYSQQRRTLIIDQISLADELKLSVLDDGTLNVIVNPVVDDDDEDGEDEPSFSPVGGRFAGEG